MNRQESRQRAEESKAVTGGFTGTVLRGAGFSGAGYVLGQALTLGFYLVLARLATPTDFGQLAAGMILVGIGLIFTQTGTLAAVIQRRDRVDEAAATAAVSSVAAGLTFSLLALAASPLVGLLFSSEVGAVAAAVSGLLFLRSLTSVPSALLQRRFSFLRRLVVEPATTIAFGVVAIIGTSSGMGVWGLVLGHYAGAVVEVSLSWGLVRWRPDLRLVSFSMWRELISYGRHVVAGNAVLRAGAEIPTALLAGFTGLAALGQYRYATRIATMPFAVLLSAASYVLFPAFARIAEEPERYRAAVRRSLRWMAVVGMPLGLILLPLGEPIATLVFGEVWRDAGFAAMALCLLPAGRALISVCSETLKADGRPQIVTRMHLVEVLVSIVAMALLLPFGLVGVAAGISVGAAAGCAYALRGLARSMALDLRAIVRDVMPPTAAAVTMAAVLTPLEQLVFDAAARDIAPGLALLTAEAMIGGAIYVVALRILAPDALGEMRRTVRSIRFSEPTPEASPEEPARCATP